MTIERNFNRRLESLRIAVEDLRSDGQVTRTQETSLLRDLDKIEEKVGRMVRLATAVGRPKPGGPDHAA